MTTLTTALAAAMRHTLNELERDALRPTSLTVRALADSWFGLHASEAISADLRDDDPPGRCGVKIRSAGRDWDVLDKDCAHRPCLALGMYTPRGKSPVGVRCCVRREHHGCPEPLPEPKPARKRRTS